MATKESITKAYKGRFNHEPQVVAQAPGRINIIGEHVDYNDGFVLPAAIAQHSIVAASKRDDGVIALYSTLFKQDFEIKIEELEPQENSWANYILGVADQLIKRKYAIGGFNLAIDGNVPLGAGLSSSASVECATTLALSELFELDVPKMDIALISQKAEHTYPGVKCGIMDQFASVFGKKDHVVKLDCRSLEYKYFPLELKDYGLLLLNTNVEHSLAASAYNDRREACEKAVALINKEHPEIKSLREATPEILEKLVKPDYPDVYTKANFVVEEIKRVHLATAALEKGDLERLGELMYKTHHGLSKEYEVSCKELDFLVDYVKQVPEVLGARVMGGGFGGCTLNLVKKDYMDELIEKISPAYQKEFNLQLTSIKVSPSDGAKIL